MSWVWAHPARAGDVEAAPDHVERQKQAGLIPLVRVTLKQAQEVTVPDGLKPAHPARAGDVEGCTAGDAPRSVPWLIPFVRVTLKLFDGVIYLVQIKACCSTALSGVMLGLEPERGKQRHGEPCYLAT